MMPCDPDDPQSWQWIFGGSRRDRLPWVIHKTLTFPSDFSKSYNGRSLNHDGVTCTVRGEKHIKYGFRLNISVNSEA